MQRSGPRPQWFTRTSTAKDWFPGSIHIIVAAAWQSLLDLAPCLLAFLLVTVALRAQPTVSGVSTDSISHSDIRISWTATGCFQTDQRIRYGFSSAYEGGAGGGIQSVAGPGANASGSLSVFGLSGLLPNTLYHFSAESSC